MPASYDLSVEQFLPVRPRGMPVADTPRRVSLPDMFVRAHELDGFEVPVPPAEAGLWRILYVLAARIAGLDDPRLEGDQWYERRDRLWAQGRFDEDAVREYFTRWCGRFDLFHSERPWLQDPRLVEQCDKSTGVNKLVSSRPAGQNQVWFSHHWEDDPQPVPSEDAVWHLLVQLFNGPSGRCAARTVGTTREGNTTAGPLRSVISFHPLGRNLFESLLAGVCPPPDSRRSRPDVAPWEADELPDPLGVPVVPGGFAALIGRFRHAVLLTPDQSGRCVIDARITWAFRHAQPPALDDPYLIYQVSKQGSTYARRAEADRAIFRDVDALLCKTVGDPGVTRPRVLDEVQHLPPPVVDHLRLRALGFDQDGQTRDKQWFAQTTPPLLGLLEERNPAAAQAISGWRRAAELAGRNLAWALRNTWIAINDPGNGEGRTKRTDLGSGPWVPRGAAYYWANADREFWRLLAQGDYAADDRVFFLAALAAFNKVTETPSVQPRIERARARARGLIFAGRPRSDSI